MIQHPNAGEYLMQKFFFTPENKVLPQEIGIVEVENKEKPRVEFLSKNIEWWESSDQLELMKTAIRYYSNDNDILDRKKEYVGNNGEMMEVPLASNTKLNHPMLRKLVKQKTNYLLSKPFSIKSEDNNFNKFIEELVDERFRQQIKRLGKEACTNGIAWVQLYYDSQSNLRFKIVPSTEVIPLWENNEHTILGAVIRYYTTNRMKENGEIEEVLRIEYHTKYGTWYFIKDKDKIKPDPIMQERAYGQFILRKTVVDENGEPILDKDGNETTESVEGTWDNIPFIAFKYNAEEIPLIKWVKNLIDDYDTITSDTSNILKDNPNAVKVIVNYDGEDLAEFNRNMATFRAVKVSEDGDVKTIETKTDIKTIEAHLKRLKDDIYISADAVDHNKDDLGQATGVALRFKYAGLDSDTDDMASEFKASMEQLLWYFLIDNRNKTKVDLLNVKYEIIFNTDTIINETEAINNVKTSIGVISDKTALSQHPWVTDVSVELDAVEEDRKRKIEENVEEMQALSTASGDEFGNGANTGGQNVQNIVKSAQADRKGN